jgi:hypothetical protein
MNQMGGGARLAAILLCAAALGVCAASRPARANGPSEGDASVGKKVWSVTEQEYLDSHAVSVLAFHDFYPEGHQGGVTIIQHGERVAACGDLRVWPAAGGRTGRARAGTRRVDRQACVIEVPVAVTDLNLNYTVRLKGEGDAVRVTVDLEKPLDPQVVSGAAFRLDFYPPAYFGKTFHIGDETGIFPREPNRPMRGSSESDRSVEPMGRGQRLTVAAEDPALRMTIEGIGCELTLIDNRKRGQEEWFAVTSPVPSDKAAGAVEWLITPNRIEGWRRDPVICVSQVGYHPLQTKRAILELDPESNEAADARLLKVDAERGPVEVLSAPPVKWGRWLRYEYAAFDFTSVREPGTYFVEYAGRRAGPFRIAEDALGAGAWQPTLHSFFPVQMCHVAVWDGGRLWHDACHVDDALQAPTDHRHFDGYAQGPTTDTQFKPYEHIPHLNVGGWHDAGDTDLAAGSQAATTHVLALAREEFGVDTDETTVRMKERLVEMHVPDGAPDIVQQVAYGAQCLLGGYRASGHSFVGIIHSEAKHYYQRGEVSRMTDNLVYDPSLGPDERTADRSGSRNDRFAFTNHDTSQEYRVAAALAAASRVLRGYDDPLADECLQTAQRAWDYEQGHPPVSFRAAYVPGHADSQEVLAAVELLLTTKEPAYAERLVALLSVVRQNVDRVGWAAARALPLVKDEAFARSLREALEGYRDQVRGELSANPFGVRWHPHIWGIGWDIQNFAVEQYYLWRAFPDLFDGQSVCSVVDFVLGCHPGNNVSFVSAVGTRSLTIAFGINRADWSFIAGGMASGTALIRPDFPELKDDIPFLWQQSEYVMPGAATYIFSVLAADAIVRERK